MRKDQLGAHFFLTNIFQLYYPVNVKVKWSRYRPGVAQRVGRGIALLFHDCGTGREWVVSSTPRPHFTPGKDPIPILQEAGWAPGPVWKGAENLVPTGIRSRTVQPAVSRYTDWATRPTILSRTCFELISSSSRGYFSIHAAYSICMRVSLTRYGWNSSNKLMKKKFASY